MRAAFGIASADAVCSCFIHKPTPTPAATAHTRATIARCGHTFRLFISAPSSCFHVEFGKEHAHWPDVTESPSDCNTGHRSNALRADFGFICVDQSASS